MAYQVLARKYRPQQFSEVIGQTHVTDTLRNAIVKNRVAHAYLFVGPRGIGKTSIARILAKALNCVKGPTPTPCDECDSCREIMEGRNLDVLEFDAASTTQVDKIREIIIDRVAYAPARGPLKIYIVDEVHMLSASSFNALLKTLEEPPAHVIFIFATTDPQKIPATIASRCQRFDLRRIARPNIMKHLGAIAKTENVTITEDALLAIARGAEGGLRDAESALDQLIAFRGDHIEEPDVLAVFGLAARQEMEALAQSIINGDIPGILRQIRTLDEQGKALPRLLVELMEYFRDLVTLRFAPHGNALDLPEAQRASLAKLSEQMEPARILRLIDLLSESENGVRHALSQKTMLEISLIRCARAVKAVSLEEILAQMMDFRKQLGDDPSSARGASEAEPLPPPPAPEQPQTPSAQRPDASAVSPTTSEQERQVLNAEWKELVDEIGAAEPRVRSSLCSARITDVDPDRVTIEIDLERSEDLAAFNKGRTARTLSRILSRRLGRHVSAVVQRLHPLSNKEDTLPADPVRSTEDRSPNTPEKPKPDKKKAPVKKRMLKNPGVRRALELFDGTIVNVRE